MGKYPRTGRPRADLDLKAGTCPSSVKEARPNLSQLVGQQVAKPFNFTVLLASYFLLHFSATSLAQALLTFSLEYGNSFISEIAALCTTAELPCPSSFTHSDGVISVPSNFPWFLDAFFYSSMPYPHILV